MKIVEKIKARVLDNRENEGITIAFLGDSVTQGCFEVFQKRDGHINTIFDKNNAYHAHLAKIFAVVYPNVPVNIINAGISGDNTLHALTRVERDVLRHDPDLVVVCFGLNDVTLGGAEKVDDYANALGEIFDKLQGAGKEVVFMTHNMMNTNLSDHITKETGEEIALRTMAIQNDGTVDLYVEAAKKVCVENGVTICDCYSKWKKLAENGANITELLANKINHPTREMNWLFAVSLFETIMGM